MKKKGFFTGLLIFILLLAACVGCVIYGIKNGVTKEVVVNTKTYNVKVNQNSEYIAALYIAGEIGSNSRAYNQDWLMSVIKQLTKDEKNVAIALNINSPGGAVYQTDEVYLALKDYTRTGRKIYVYQEDLAASGGYYISCAGNKIYANRNTLTGSIGVISGQTFEVTGFFDKVGIKSETIHAGKNKNMGNYNEPMTDEQRAIMQSIADECYEQFTSIVANSRNIEIDKVYQLADGRIYTAKQALQENLIDKISTWDEMIKDLRKNELNNQEYKIIDFKVPQTSSFRDLLSYAKSFIENSKISAQTGLPLKVIEQMNSTRKYPAFIYEN